MDNKKLIVLRGASGAGKSTIAKMIAGSTGKVFAADDYPGRYKDGKYDASLNAQAHEWCQMLVGDEMHLETSPIVVANTNMKLAYLKPYLEMAKNLGYSAQVIACEGVLLPDGTVPKNLHDTPQSVIEAQLDGFQPMHPPEPGVTAQECVDAMKALSLQETGMKSYQVVCDLVGTLIFPKPGLTYINSVSDIDLERIESFAALDAVGVKRIAIASNQLGVGSGYLDVRFLDELAAAVTAMTKPFGIEMTFTFAIERNSRSAIDYSTELQRHEISLEVEADKPNIGMLRFLSDCDSREIIYIGDAHQPGRTEDVSMVRRASKSGMKITYLPAECLQIYG